MRQPGLGAVARMHLRTLVTLAGAAAVEFKPRRW
jgi:hypothetical protein